MKFSTAFHPISSILLSSAAASGASSRRINEFVMLEGHTVTDNYHSPLPHEWVLCTTGLTNNINPRCSKISFNRYIAEEDLPISWDWRNVSGHSFLTHSLNQHIPQYCELQVAWGDSFITAHYLTPISLLLIGGSWSVIIKERFICSWALWLYFHTFSWAHGALSALADRIKIARNAVGDDINLSIQWVLNCGGGALLGILCNHTKFSYFPCNRWTSFRCCW